MAFVCDIPAVPTVQLDDEAVRITRWDFAPGAVTGWHEHAFPYLVVLATDAILRVHDGQKVVEAPFRAGDAYRRPKGVRHDVMNGSAHPIAFIEIEIKHAGAFAA